MPPLWSYAAALVALTTLGATGCEDGPQRRRLPDVLLISVDTLRRDHLGAYGYARPTSPRIDALAAEGVLFTNAVSPSSWTLPAHASLLTGLYPAGHGLRDDGVKLARGVRTLAESLRDLGYRGLAVVSHVYVSSEFGLERGFEVLDDSLTEGGTTNPIASEVVDRFLEHVDDAGDGPFFGFVHFFDPHWSYTPPAPFDTFFSDPAYRGPVDGTLASLAEFFAPNAAMPAEDRRHAIDLYDGEIRYLDGEVGRLLDALRERGRMRDGIVILTADHGEEFKEHGQLGHAKTLFGEQLRVPLIVSGLPGSEPGTRRNHLVTPIDIAPTLLEVLGGSAPEGLDGRSLRSPPDPERVVFAETKREGREIRAIRQGRYKLIHYAYADRRLFYDLARDPFERSPLSVDPSDGVLSTALDDYAAHADAGWHLKWISLDGDPLAVRVRIHTEGRLVDVRRYAAQRIAHGTAEFSEVVLASDEKSLVAEARVAGRVAELVFETDPPDAPVRIVVEPSDGEEGALVYLGDDETGATAGEFGLARNDPRLRGLPSLTAERRGVFVRTVDPPTRHTAPATLSPEARARLEALGYVDE